MSEHKASNPLFVHAFVLMLAGAGLATSGVIGIVQARGASGEEGGEKPAEAPKANPKEAPKHGAPAAEHGTEDPKALEAAKNINEANNKIMTTQSDVQQVQAIGQQPLGLGTLGSAAGAITSLGHLKMSAGAVLDLGLPVFVILSGIAMIVMGVFVLKERNWARKVGFALLALSLLYFAYMMAGRMGNPTETPVIGALVLLVATPVAAKFLWDLMVEKLSGGTPAPAGAHGHGH